ncbi:MAG: hypothetical protein IT381_23450 [Deltaproteobacteria bacterium]|nr:hypothetical protein [Deltaproteobacteria bacterium]
MAEIQSFKVGDKVGRNKPAGPQKAQEEEKPSAGFPRVEALIDEYQTADQAKETFADSISQIEGMLAVEKNPKKKAELVKIKRAFEHTMATLDYLFQVRTELAQANAAPEMGAKKPNKKK